MWSYFLRGGIMMWPLLVCSILAVGIIINRGWVFYKARVNEERLMKVIRRSLKEGKVKEAVSLCQSTPGPVAKVLERGLLHYHQGKKGIEAAFEMASLEEFPRLETYLPVLATIAGVSTLFGFTGTVLGMIRAFDSIVASGVSSPVIVARGVGEALITTAFGLLVAIPTLISYHYFMNRYEKFILETEKCCKETIDLISGETG